MVAVITGTGLGLERSSAQMLGSAGQLGQAVLGRANDQVYVNAATGNLVIQNTDEILIGRGPDAVIARTYNSLGVLNGDGDDNNDNWRLSVMRKIVGSPGGTVKRIDWDGSEVTYTYDDGIYTSAKTDGPEDSLTYNSGTGLWTWTDSKSRVVDVYDSTGRLLRTVDADGNTLTVNASGLITQVDTADGGRTKLIYDGTKLMSIETYAVSTGGVTLTRVHYEYSGNRLWKVKVDLSPEDSSISDGNFYWTTYEYDSGGRVNLISQADGSSLAIGYTQYGSEYRVTSLVQTVASGVTRTTTISYDLAASTTTITDPAGRETKLKYDSLGRLLEKTLDAQGTPQLFIYTYTTGGELETVTDPAGGVTTYLYDTAGNRTQSQDPAGNRVTYTYDANNQLLTETRYLVAGSAGNQAPTAVGDYVVATAVGDSATFDPRLNDGDPEGDTLTITAVSTPTKGTATIVGGTKITYTRTSAGPDSFTYTISDGQGHSVTATVTVLDTAGLSNSAPTAVGDSTVVTGIGSSLTFDPRGNDSDPEGDALTITAVSTPSKGTATIVGGTKITYTRTSAGNDSFTYTISDGHGQTTTATITITDTTSVPNQAPVMVNDVQTVSYVGNTLTFDPRANDSDFDADTLTITAISTPSYGTASIVGGTKITYIRTGLGLDSFTYTISDGQGHSQTATITVKDFTHWSNLEPEAFDDTITVEGAASSLAFDPRVNDQAYDTDALTITAVSTPSFGTATIINGGTGIRYTRNFPGNDSFTYTISDGDGGVVTATVTVQDPSVVTNSAPTAVDEAGGSTINVARIFDPRWNDTDPDGDFLTITAISTPTKGTATIINGGTAISYTRTTTGMDTFTYTISDGQGHTATGTITTLALPPTNVAPIARNDTVAAATSVTFDPRLNDGDVDVNPLTITAVSTPTNGTATIVNGGTAIQYVRTGPGTDSFTYTISDGTTTATATITVTEPNLPLNLAPTAMAESVFVNAIGDSVTFDPRVNDTDFDADSLTIIAVSSPSNGTASIVGGGAGITFTRTSAGPGSFSYTISDGRGHTSTAWVSVTDSASANQAPTAANDSVTVANGAALTFDPRATDADANGDPLTITAVSAPSRGTVTIAADGTKITYTRTSVGADSFTYIISDGHGGTTTATVTVLDPALSGNQPPVAVNNSIIVNGIGDATTFDPRINDTDFNANTLTITAVSTPSKGTATIVSGTKITYTRTSAGADSFTYTISDGQGNTRTATVYVGGATTAPPKQILTTRYVYDSENHLRFVISSLGEVTEYVYDTPGRRTSSIIYRDHLYSGVVSESALATWTGTLDRSTVQRTDTTYFTNGAVDTETRFGKTLTGGAGDNTATTEISKTIYIYDTAGRLLSRRWDGSMAAEVYVYDGLGRVTASTDFNGLSTTIAFTDAQTITTVTVGGQLTKTSTYNKAGELISYAESAANMPTSTKTYKYDALGRLRVVTDPTKLSTYCLYDHIGRKVADIDANGSLVEYGYNASDLLIKTIRYKNPLSAAQMASLVDSSGNPTTVQLASVRPTLPDAADRWEWRIYDSASRLVEVIDGVGAATVYAYDGASQLVSTTAYANNLPGFYIEDYKTTPPTAMVFPYPTESIANRATRNFYDADGRLAGTLDGEGYLTQIIYDGAGNKTHTIGYAAPTVESHRASATFGELLADVTLGVAANPKDIHNWFVYDGRGFLRGAIDGEGNLSRYHYDARGYLDQEIRGYKLDPATLLTAPPTLATLPTSSGEILETTAWTRNFYGQALTETRTLASGSETITYTYDTHGRLTEAVTTGASVDSRTQTHRYDGRGRLIGTLSGIGSAELAANPSQIESVYDTYGTTYVYDTADRLIAKIEPEGITDAGRKTVYYYDADNNLTHVVNALGEVTEYKYNTFGQRTDTILYAGRISSTRLATLVGGLNLRAGGPELKGAFGYNASASHFGGLTPPGMVDGANDSSSTVFAVENGYMLVDLGASCFVDHIALLPIASSFTTFGPWGIEDLNGATVHYSTNNVNWTSAGTISGASDVAYLAHSIGATARYIRITNSATLALGLGDFRIYATSPIGDITGAVAEIANSAADTQIHLDYNVTGTVSQSTDALGTTTTYTYDLFRGMVGKTERLEDTVFRSTSYSHDRRGLLLNSTRDTAGLNLSTSTVYDAFGRAIQVTDPNNTVRSTAYDRAGRVVSTTDAFGLTTTFTYDGRNNVLSRTDRNGNQTNFTYNAFSRQVTMTTPEGVVTTTTTSAYGQTLTLTEAGRTTTYTYDKDGNLKTATDYAATTASTYNNAGELVQTTVDPGDTSHLNLTTTYAYDQAGRVLTRIVDPGDASHLNLTTSYAYDGKGQQILVTDAVGTVTKIEFDKKGQKTSVIVDYGAEPEKLNLTTTYAYDRAGRMLTVTEGTVPVDARVTAYAYDKADRLSETTVDPGAGHLNLTTTYTYDKNGNAVAKTDDAGAVTRYVYDAENRLIYTVDAERTVTKLSYDGEGRVTTVRVYAAQVASVTLNGWPLAISATDVTTAAAISASDRVTRQIYDRDGKVFYEVDAEGYVTGYEYNTFGDVKKKIRFADIYKVGDGATKAAMAAMIGTPIPSTAAVTTYGYDGAGRIVNMTDAEGVVAGMVYDAAGRMKYFKRADNSDDYSLTLRTYDAAGRLVTETRAQNTAEASTTTYTYDDMGRVENTTDGRGYTTVREYDAAGRLLEVTVPLNATESAETTNQYDAFGNIVKVTDPLGGEGFFYYDKAGRLILQVDPERYATSTEYSAGGEAIKVTRHANKITGSVVVGTLPSINLDAAEDAVTLITRDKLDRVTAITDAEGHIETYTLNAFGDRVSVTAKSSSAATDGLRGVTTYTYDKRGLMLSETFVNINVVNTYAYDSRGNRIRSVEAYGLPEARTTNYVYDKLDRLIQKTGDAFQAIGEDLTTFTTVVPTETYAYDRRGNLVETVDAAGARTVAWYDDLDRKTYEINALGTLSTWTYDKNGNVTSAKVYGETVTQPTPRVTSQLPTLPASYRETLYAYDRNNRLTTTTVAGLLTGEFGAAYATTTGNVVSTRVYDLGGNVRELIDGRGNRVLMWYDKLGHETGRVDQENYLTTYTRDSDGNAVKEERFATQLTGTITKDSVLTALRTSVAGNAADRITDFEYDQNGRRTKETRRGVAIWTVDATTGALSQSGVTDSIIRYAYNGLGQVTQKIEANNDQVDYVYDHAGRQSSATYSAFTDYLGAGVQRRTANLYDGLNNLTWTAEGAVGGAAADDRVTTFTYGAGGRMQTMTDAAGFLRSFGYDAAGRTVFEGYTRSKSTGSPITEATAYRYDALGRVILQAAAVNTGVTWKFGDKTHLRYNVFGEVTGKGLTAGTATTPVYQETFDYDDGGRMWRTNSGDGVSKLYVYDKTGKVTLEITSAGTDLSSHTVASALSVLTNSGANAVGAAFVSGVNPTITVYDKRGQNTQTRETFRELRYNASNPNLIDKADLIHSRAYNAFGEVRQETNARNYVTDFTYNTMGRLIKKESPSLSYTLENGTAQTGRPTEEYRYDVSGRLVAVMDANGYTNKRTLLAHTGHGKSEAKVTAEFHADNAITRVGFDVFGDERKFTNALGHIETRAYDKMGRLTTLTRPNRAGDAALSIVAQDGLVENYTYDAFGRRLTHWNSQLGSAVKETTDYDLQGRVTKMVDFGGDATTYAYSFDGALATTGMGTFGGWTKTTVNTAGLTATEKQDYFGRRIDKVDYGAHDYAYTYDTAGRLSVQTNSAGQSQTYTWFNTGAMRTLLDDSYPVDGSNNERRMQSTFGYDAEGNRVVEKYVALNYVNNVYQSTRSQQDAVATYDALNRILTLTDTGDNATVPINLTYTYDKAGNVRRVYAIYEDAVTGTNQTQDFWYRYDAMDRFVITRGSLVSGAIVRGAKGTEVTYDAAGQRKTAKTDYNWDSVLRRDEYYYTEDGYLQSVKVAEGTGSAVLRAKDVRDQMGRVTKHYEYTGNGTTEAYYRSLTFNAKSQITNEQTRTLRDNGHVGVVNNYYYYTDNSTGAYMGGVVTKVLSTNNYRIEYPGQPVYPLEASNETKTSFVWWDDARQNVITYKPNLSQSTTYTSTFTYDYNGHAQKVDIADGQGSRRVDYTTDKFGQVMVRREVKTGATMPVNYYYYLGGERVGETSNNGPSDIDYVTSINRRNDAQTNQWAWSGSPQSMADFDQSYDGIDPTNSGEQATGSRYTVRDGDSLMTIAELVWGDASMWYLIAQANGMDGSEPLAAGMTILIPAKVTNLHNSSDTFKVYDPNKALGDIMPTRAAKPPKKDKCGIQHVIAAIVAIAVFVVTRNVMAAAKTFSALTTTLVAAAAASTASQLAGMAMGIQDKFSWKQVGLSMLTAGVSHGVNVSGFLSVAADAAVTPTTIALDFARGAVSSAITQGIAKPLGLIDKFSWTSVAVAGISSSVQGAVSRSLPERSWAVRDAQGAIIDQGGPSTGNLIVSGMAGAIANAASRSAMNGGDFGENLRWAMPDVIASTIGLMIEDGLADTGAGPQEETPLEHLLLRGGEAANNALRAAGDALEGLADLGGKALTAAGDFFGFDGEFGYQGAPVPASASASPQMNFLSIGAEPAVFIGMAGLEKGSPLDMLRIGDTNPYLWDISDRKLGFPNYDIDRDFIKIGEGGFHTEAYTVKGFRYSGVTLGVGVDLGQHNAAEFKAWGLTPDEIKMLEPYTKVKGAAAVAYLNANPLTVSNDLANRLTDGAFRGIVSGVRSRWDSNSQVKFAELPGEIQTVLIDIAYTKGAGGLRSNFTNGQFWKQAAGGNWNGAYETLKREAESGEYGYRGRRAREAVIFKGVIDSGVLTRPATPPTVSPITPLVRPKVRPNET